MPIPIETTDKISLKDLKRLILVLCQKNGIMYNFKYPQDMYTLSYIFKELKKYNKPSYVSTMFLEWVFNNYKFKKINSLAFLRSEFNYFRSHINTILLSLKKEGNINDDTPTIS